MRAQCGSGEWVACVVIFISLPLCLCVSCFCGVVDADGAVLLCVCSACVCRLAQEAELAHALAEEDDDGF